MRSTKDFRSSGEGVIPTLLETREWFRARAEMIDADRAWDSLRLNAEQSPMADWTRIVRSQTPSVKLGHYLLREALGAELREFSTVVRINLGTEVSEQGIVDLLNREPSRCVTADATGAPQISVLGMGRWAAFEQRNLCSAIAADFAFMHKRWGVPEEAAAYRDKLDALFSGLRLYPLVRRQNATDVAYYKKAQDDSMALVRRSPHLVPAEAWNEICYEVPFGPIYIPPPHAFINEWHKLNPLPGTAYHPFPRMNHPSLVSRPDAVARLEQMHRLAPYDTIITHNLLRLRDGDEPTAGKIEEAYARVIDYYPTTSRQLARLKAQDPEQFEKWMWKAVALDPSYLEDLADWFVARKQEDRAATTYAQWMANENNELRVAASAEWLVQYLERKGQTEKAAQLAERAAMTGSSAGFMTKARHLTRCGKIDEALEVYLENQRRYHAPGALIAFILKLPAAQRTVRCQQELKAATEKIFPSGLQKLAVSGKAAAPKVGVRVQKENDLIREAGLQQDDIIATVRGYQVPSWQGFTVLRSLDEDAPFEMQVWRKDRYLTLKLPARYRFGINLADFASP